MTDMEENAGLARLDKNRMTAALANSRGGSEASHDVGMSFTNVDEAAVILGKKRARIGAVQMKDALV